mmetsp:Transcript_13782/g.35641  ORF Transcript_13782/g.35641 Transcript_13782/m.35641 type:complete len:338 (+) Transcript_13782:109-1122(+)
MLKLEPSPPGTFIRIACQSDKCSPHAALSCASCGRYRKPNTPRSGIMSSGPAASSSAMAAVQSASSRSMTPITSSPHSTSDVTLMPVSRSTPPGTSSALRSAEASRTLRARSAWLASSSTTKIMRRTSDCRSGFSPARCLCAASRLGSRLRRRASSTSASSCPASRGTCGSRACSAGRADLGDDSTCLLDAWAPASGAASAAPAPSPSAAAASTAPPPAFSPCPLPPPSACMPPSPSPSSPPTTTASSFSSPSAPSSFASSSCCSFSSSSPASGSPVYASHRSGFSSSNVRTYMNMASSGFILPSLPYAMCLATAAGSNMEGRGSVQGPSVAWRNSA